MATRIVQPIGDASGRAETILLPEGSAQTFLKGAALTLSAGQVIQATASPATVIGFALQDASGVQATNVLVAVAQFGKLWEGNLVSSGVPALETLAAATIGSLAGLVLIPGGAYTGIWALAHINKAGGVTTTAGARILRRLDDSGDGYGRVQFALRETFNALEA